MPLVSVVIPAYNHAKYIKDAINSVIEQTYQNIEIIIVNDGSTDDTESICKELEKKHSCIKYFYHDNIGAHNTINKAVCLSTGKYIAVLNSDDIFYRNKIARCIEIVNSHCEIEFISGNIHFIDENNKIQTKGISIDWQKRAQEFYDKANSLPISCLNENFIATTSNMFFSKSLWELVGGFNALRYCHDLDFMMAAFRNCKYYYDKDQYHIQYRVHTENTIKEDIQKVRVELSAVLASSLVIDNMSLLHSEDVESSKIFNMFLDNKNMSNLLVYMMMYYIKLGDRKLFFENIYNNNQKSKFLQFN